MDQTILEKLKKALEGEHKKLVAELKSIADPNPRGENWDAKYPQFTLAEYGSHGSLEEEADEVEEYETRLETGHSLESRLLEVSRALGRIEKGIFGKCVSCGRAIPYERLEANPAAEYDMEHSSKNV